MKRVQVRAFGGRFAGAGLAAAFLACVACSSFSEGDIDPPAARDGGDPVADGAIPFEGAAEASAADAAGGPFSCKALDASYVFCDDFELEVDPPGYWGASTTTSTASSLTIVNDGTNKVLRVLAVGGAQQVNLARALPIDVKVDLATVEADIRVVSGGYFSCALIDLMAAGASNATSIGLGAYGIELVPSRAAAGGSVTATVGQWHHIVMSLGVRKPAADTRAELAVDGTVLVDAGADASGTGALMLRAGVMETSDSPNETPTLTIDFDNVRVRAH